mgnify:CR=1 FL=1
MKPLILTLHGELEENYGPTIAVAEDPFPVIIAIRVKTTTNRCNHVLHLYYLKHLLIFYHSKKLFPLSTLKFLPSSYQSYQI